MTSNTISYRNQVRWGIIGTGRIAHTFAKALVSCDGAVPCAIASRTKQKADEFAAECGFLKACGSYAELAQDPDVDVVYIATPMSAHYHDAKLCLENGKHVLCEKSVTLNSKQLEELLDLAKRNGLFFMEAMWMKCRPVYRKAMEWVHEGKIGNIRCIKAGFCNLIPYNANDRLFRTDCGGGALLDLAVYPLTLVHNLLGVPGSVRTYAHIQNGIDLSNTILLAYEDAFAAVESSFEYPSRNHAMISGSEGMILFGDMFHYANEVCRYDRSLHLVETYSQEDRINGYEYEIEEVMHCLRNGLQDSMLVPQRATLEVMRIMDECRKQWGMQFPDENLDDLKAFSDELQSRFAETQKSGDST